MSDVIFIKAISLFSPIRFYRYLYFAMRKYFSFFRLKFIRLSHTVLKRLKMHVKIFLFEWLYIVGKQLKQNHILKIRSLFSNGYVDDTEKQKHAS